MSKKLVIIGSGTAGASIALAARKADRTAEITVLDREPYPTYSKCALPFVIEGIIKDFEDITVFSRGFYKQQKVNLIGNAEVTEIDPDARKVVYRKEGAEHAIEYDKLGLTTGGYAWQPEIEGDGTGNIFTLRNIADGEKIREAARSSKKAVVNGASFIAIEVAEALMANGVDTTMIVRSRVVRTMIDADISRLLMEHLTSKGLKVVQGSTISRIIGDRQIKAVVAGDEELPCDMLVNCTGVRSEVSLARKIGLETGSKGGIVVDKTMKTANDDIYTAGDCAEDHFGLMGFPFISLLGTVATRQGVVAGSNMAGVASQAPAFYNAAVLKLFGMQTGSVGLTSDIAEENGLKVESMRLTHTTLPHYYPGGKPVVIKLLAHPETQEVLGAQVMAEETVPETINTMSLAIQRGMTVSEVAMADFCYAPPCADIWAPASVAAQGLERKLAARARRKKK